jgi:signal peptidase I
VLPAPPPSQADVRATRVILLIGGALLAILLAGGIAVGLAAYSIGWTPGIRTVHVIGQAMAPTLRDGDYVRVEPYAKGNPRPGDVVIMRDPYDPSRDFVKRVVAIPGQSVLIRGAQVSVDGRQLTESYIDPQQPWTVSVDWPASGNPVILAPDEYFVLGDNRNHSSDSRIFGPIHRAAILGRATRIMFPTNRAGPV